MTKKAPRTRFRNRETPISDAKKYCTGENIYITKSPYSENHNPYIGPWLLWSEGSSQYTQDVTGNFGGNNPFLSVTQKTSEADGYLSFEYDTGPNSKTKAVRQGPVTQHLLTASGHEIETPPDVSTRDLALIIGDAKAKAVARIESTPFQFGEDVAELRKSLEFIEQQGSLVKDVNKTLVRGLKDAEYLRRNFARGNYRAIVNKLPVSGLPRKLWEMGDNLSRLVLTCNFGYGNILRSIDNAATAFEQRDRSRPVQHLAKGSAESKDSVTALVKSYWDNKTRYDAFTFTRARYVSARAVIQYHVSDPVSGFRFDLGLRGQDLLPTAWAVMPASWFIDSFYNVSDALKSVANLANPDLVIERAWVSTRTNDDTTWKYVFSQNPGVSYSGSGMPFIAEYEAKERTPWSPTFSDAFPIPGIPSMKASTIMNDTAQLILWATKTYPRAFAHL